MSYSISKDFLIAKQFEICNTTQRLNTFSMRIIDHWNNLSEYTVTTNSINIFKSRLNEENWNEKKIVPT